MILPNDSYFVQCFLHLKENNSLLKNTITLFLQLDVSGDGVNDCIVRGSKTMLFMIEVRYGTILWHVHQHKKISSKHSCLEYQLMTPFT